MRNARYIISVFFYYALLHSVIASPVDSLKNELKEANTDKKIELYIKISQYFIQNNPDSALKYAILAENLSQINNLQNVDLLNQLPELDGFKATIKIKVLFQILVHTI